MGACDGLRPEAFCCHERELKHCRSGARPLIRPLIPKGHCVPVAETASLGAMSCKVASLAELERAVPKARAA